MPRRYWLFKSEPGSFSIDDLAAEPEQTTVWDGVRNYQARNYLRDEVSVGDGVLFYHSNTDPPGIVGFCRVVRAGYPDPTAFDPRSKYFDPRSSPDRPRWYAVDVRLERRLAEMIPLARLKITPGLEDMLVCKRGTRLSIQPVADKEWRIITELARGS